MLQCVINSKVWLCCMLLAAVVVVGMLLGVLRGTGAQQRRIAFPRTDAT
jgi:hypothetical protein